MIKRLIGLSLLVLILLLSVSVKSQIQKLYLNPSAVGNEKQTNVIDSVRFFPLAPHADVEMKNYLNVQVTEKHFLLFSYAKKMIFFYSKEGEFQKSISFKHLGENFFPEYMEETNQLVLFGSNKHYSLTPKDRIRIEMNWSNPRNRKYYRKYVIDLSDTNYAIKKAVPGQYDVAMARHLYDDRYLQGRIMTSNLFKDSLGYELKILSNNNTLQSFFPYNRIHDPMFDYTEEMVLFSKTDTPGICYITRPYCDTIYKLARDSLFPAYQLVLPLENTLPAAFRSRSFKNKSDRTNFERNNAWKLHQVYMFFETPRLIFISISFLSNGGSFIYNKNTKTTYKGANVKGDSTHYNLDLLSSFALQMTDGRFYKLIKAGDLLSFFEKNKATAPPPGLKDFVNSHPSPETPVVVSFKLKS